MNKCMLHSMARQRPRVPITPDESETEEHEEQPAPPPPPVPPPVAGDTSDEMSSHAIVPAVPAADPPRSRRTWAVAFTPGSTNSSDADSEPADDPNDRDFVPSPLLQRPRADGVAAPAPSFQAAPPSPRRPGGVMFRGLVIQSPDGGIGVALPTAAAPVSRAPAAAAAPLSVEEDAAPVPPVRAAPAPAAANTLPPRASTFAHDMASARQELLVLMAGQGHQPAGRQAPTTTIITTPPSHTHGRTTTIITNH